MTDFNEGDKVKVKQDSRYSVVAGQTVTVVPQGEYAYGGEITVKADDGSKWYVQSEDVTYVPKFQPGDRITVADGFGLGYEGATGTVTAFETSEWQTTEGTRHHGYYLVKGSDRFGSVWEGFVEAAVEEVEDETVPEFAVGDVVVYLGTTYLAADRGALAVVKTDRDSGTGYTKIEWLDTPERKGQQSGHYTLEGHFEVFKVERYFAQTPDLTAHIEAIEEQLESIKDTLS